MSVRQGCTNPYRKVAVASKVCTVAPNICGSSVWKLLYVTSLGLRIFRWLPGFWKLCAPLLLQVSATFRKEVILYLRYHYIFFYGCD